MRPNGGGCANWDGRARLTTVGRPRRGYSGAPGRRRPKGGRDVADGALHVAVDGRELLGKPTGVGRYLAEVLAEWAAMTDGPRVTVVVRASPAPRVAATAAALERDRAASRAPGTRCAQ